MEILTAIAVVWMNGYLVFLIVSNHKKYPDELNGKILLLFAAIFLVINGLIFDTPDPIFRVAFPTILPFLIMLSERGYKFYNDLPAVRLAREKREEETQRKALEALYKNISAPEPYALSFVERFKDKCLQAGFVPPPSPQLQTIHSIVVAIYRADFFPSPNAEIQAALLSKKATLQNILDLFEKHLFECFLAYARAIPPEQGGVVRVPLISVIQVGPVIRDMFTELWDNSPKKEYGLFGPTMTTIHANYWRVSRAHLSEKKIADRERMYPVTFPGTPKELVQEYCRDTPFSSLFDIEVPLPIEKQRFEHQFVLAPSGTGKTQLLQAQIADDLERVEKGEVSLIVIDSQGINRRATGKPTLVENLIGLQVFAKEMRGKLNYIKPSPDLAFNIFDMGQYDPRLTKEQRTVRLTAAREIVATALGGGSDLQYQMLLWCIRLAFLTDKPTIVTLRRILAADEKDFPRLFKDALDKADELTRDYFASIRKGTRNATREALITRIDGLFSDDTFREMLQKPTNDFQMIDEMEAGKVIVIDADKALIGEVGAETFGRFFLAQLLHASRQRESNKPVYCYMDECQDFISNDENISKLLLQARKQDIGLILATQNLANINSQKVKENLQDVAIVMQANTDKAAGTFNVKLRGRAEPIEVTAPNNVMENMPRMTAAEFAEVHAPRKRALPGAPPPASPPPVDDEPDVL